VALPKAIREQLGLGEGTSPTVRVKCDEVILRKAPAGSWKEWESRFKGSDLLEELTRSRQKEMARGRTRS
jgi:bifunctional DNA-binding transcriptional regulator/antitoxin component of YhaV-PrlF toxin-antitoxin module